MLFKHQYQNETDRQSILDVNSSKILIEEQNIAEGNFLIFSDAPRMEEEVQRLKEDNLILMSALADIYIMLLPA